VCVCVCVCVNGRHFEQPNTACHLSSWRMAEEDKALWLTVDSVYLERLSLNTEHNEKFCVLLWIQ
jgi:hypothetical protein